MPETNLQDCISLIDTELSRNFGYSKPNFSKDFYKAIVTILESKASNNGAVFTEAFKKAGGIEEKWDKFYTFVKTMLNSDHLKGVQPPRETKLIFFRELAKQLTPDQIKKLLDEIKPLPKCKYLVTPLEDEYLRLIQPNTQTPSPAPLENNTSSSDTEEQSENDRELTEGTLPPQQSFFDIQEAFQQTLETQFIDHSLGFEIFPQQIQETEMPNFILNLYHKIKEKNIDFTESELILLDDLLAGNLVDDDNIPFTLRTPQTRQWLKLFLEYEPPRIEYIKKILENRPTLFDAESSFLDTKSRLAEIEMLLITAFATRNNEIIAVLWNKLGSILLQLPVGLRDIPNSDESQWTDQDLFENYLRVYRLAQTASQYELIDICRMIIQQKTPFLSDKRKKDLSLFFPANSENDTFNTDDLLINSFPSTVGTNPPVEEKRNNSELQQTSNSFPNKRQKTTPSGYISSNNSNSDKWEQINTPNTATTTTIIRVPQFQHS